MTMEKEAYSVNIKQDEANQLFALVSFIQNKTTYNFTPNPNNEVVVFCETMADINRFKEYLAKIIS